MRQIAVHHVEINITHRVIGDAPEYYVAKYPALHFLAQKIGVPPETRTIQVEEERFQVVRMHNPQTGETRCYGVTSGTIEAFKDLMGYSEQEVNKLISDAYRNGYVQGKKNCLNVIKRMSWYKRLFINHYLQ